MPKNGLEGKVLWSDNAECQKEWDLLRSLDLSHVLHDPSSGSSAQEDVDLLEVQSATKRIRGMEQLS